jgi:hypothetical protein
MINMEVFPGDKAVYMEITFCFLYASMLEDLSKKEILPLPYKLLLDKKCGKAYVTEMYRHICERNIALSLIGIEKYF